MRWGGNDGGKCDKKLQKQVVFNETTCFCWSEMGDSNSRHLAPKASALPTALIPDLGFEFCARCGQTCGQAVFLTTSACGGSACIAGVSRDRGHGISRLEGGATRSQTKRDADSLFLDGEYYYSRSKHACPAPFSAFSAYGRVS